MSFRPIWTTSRTRAYSRDRVHGRHHCWSSPRGPPGSATGCWRHCRSSGAMRPQSVPGQHSTGRRFQRERPCRAGPAISCAEPAIYRAYQEGYGEIVRTRKARPAARWPKVTNSHDGCHRSKVEDGGCWSLERVLLDADRRWRVRISNLHPGFRPPRTGGALMAQAWSHFSGHTFRWTLIRNRSRDAGARVRAQRRRPSPVAQPRRNLVANDPALKPPRER
jgi:hypothetical protein